MCSIYVYLTAVRLFLFFLSFSFLTYGQKNEKHIQHQVLWELYQKENPDVKNFLFASLPINDKRVFDLPDSLYQLMNSVDALLIERNFMEDYLEADSRISTPKINFDQNGNPYSRNSNASKTLFGDENGMPQFLDMFILEYMSKLKKKVIALNNDIVSVFWRDLKDHKKNVFVSTNWKYRNDQFIELYLEKSIHELNRYLKLYLSKKDSSFYHLIESKTNTLVLNLIPYVEKQSNSLIVLGVQYFGGENGLIAQLRKKGFVIRPIQLSYNRNTLSIQKNISQLIKTEYYDSISKIHVSFPGVPFIEYRKDGSKKLIYKELGQGNTYQIEVFPRTDSLTEEQIAQMYIMSPINSEFNGHTMDNGTYYFEGLSDTYPEGLNWTRILINESYYAVCKSYGGNLFLNSNRSSNFFNSIWFDLSE